MSDKTHDPDEPFDQYSESSSTDDPASDDTRVFDRTADDSTTQDPDSTTRVERPARDEENPMDQPRTLGDRYEVGELLGRGGMAEVHGGRDLRLGRKVAIKSLRVDLARDPSFQARFRREAQSAASLNHPNIVAIYDTGEETIAENGGTLAVPYLVMEAVDGTTLRALLSSGRRLLPERALEITSGVLAALDYSHRHGIVHRDIKPANVMLTNNGEIKVMDFGIARAVADPASTMTQTGATLGTAQYLSPEQAQGGSVDPRSDIYSTGCMLYELLTGKPPFTGESPVSVAYQHVRENPVPPSQIDPDVPPAIDAIVMKALAKNADNRYQTASDMREDIQRALGGRPVAATPVMDATQAIAVTPAMDDLPPKDDKGRRTGFIVLALAVAALLIGGVLLLLNLGGNSGPQVPVPDLTGKTAAQATSTLEAKKLKLGEQTMVDSDKPENTIISQDPAPPASVKEGTAINVTISRGPAKTEVPVVTGLLLDEALDRLDQAKLVVGDRTFKSSDEPANTVLEVDPKEGSEVAEGSKVDLVVSNGKADIPKVTGLPEAQAKADLTNAGFKYTVVRAVSQTADPGTVTAQSPSAGTNAKQGTIVTITVASAPPTTPPPTPTATPSVP